MASFVLVVFGPMEFLSGFLISEFIALLVNSRKEGLHMVKKALVEVIASAKRIKGRFIASWEAHRPSRHSLLMSL